MVKCALPLSGVTRDNFQIRVDIVVRYILRNEKYISDVFMAYNNQYSTIPTFFEQYNFWFSVNNRYLAWCIRFNGFFDSHYCLNLSKCGSQSNEFCLHCNHLYLYCFLLYIIRNKGLLRRPFWFLLSNRCHISKCN